MIANKTKAKKGCLIMCPQCQSILSSTSLTIFVQTNKNSNQITLLPNEVITRFLNFLRTGFVVKYFSRHTYLNPKQ